MVSEGVMGAWDGASDVLRDRTVPLGSGGINKSGPCKSRAEPNPSVRMRPRFSLSLSLSSWSRALALLSVELLLRVKRGTELTDAPEFRDLL